MIDLAYSFEEVASSPPVQKMLSKFVFIQRDDVARAFYRVWVKHYNVWDSIERKEQHSVDNISRITWDNKQKLFKVYYRKTKHFSSVRYRYTLSGEWY